MKRLIKKSLHDYHNRDLALVYINGEIYESDTHSDCFKQYALQHKNSENFDNYTSLITDYNTTNDEIAFAHLVENQNAIFIEIYSMQNVDDQNKIIKEYKKEYPDYNIYSDDSCRFDSADINNYEKIAKNSRLRKNIIADGYESLTSTMPARIIFRDMWKKIVPEDEIEDITYGPNISREFTFERPNDHAEWNLQTSFTKNL